MTRKQEKRSFTRITLDIQGSITLYQMEAFHTGAITNISLSGCYFPFDGELPVGEHCKVTITVGEGLETEDVTLAGKIVRNDTKGVGISFTDGSPESGKQLEKIISHDSARRLP